MQRDMHQGEKAERHPSLSFETPLEHEEEILDSLLGAQAEGVASAEAWGRLHQAALRDHRVHELAVAYETTSQSKRLKALTPEVISEFEFEAAKFCIEVSGNEVGAVVHLERALAAVPSHTAAFDHLGPLLEKAGNTKRLAEIHAEAAWHRPREEQEAFLRKAAQLFESSGGPEEKVIELQQQVLKLDPTDEALRNSLEKRFVRANRPRDLARLFEQTLSTFTSPDPEHDLQLRARLIELYTTTLREPDKTIPHLEALLAVQPGHAEALAVANSLLGVKAQAARAASILADAHDALGRYEDVSHFLSLELEHARGPRRREVLRRLGVTKQDRLSDPAGAYEAFVAALALDPSDNDTRARYAVLARALGKETDAARMLSRFGTVVQDAPLRTRIAAEMGELLLWAGDVKKARATFAGVLTSADADPQAILRSARALAQIHAEEKDHIALADALARIVQIEIDPEQKRIYGEQLATLASDVLHDSNRAIAAWRELVDTPSRLKALAALEPLYAATDDRVALAFVLEERAKDETRPDEARQLSMRAAIALTAAGDSVRAAGSWERVVERFGPSREVFAHWIPLLEQLEKWPELVQALQADADLAPAEDQTATLLQLGHILLSRLADVPSAIKVYARILVLSPDQPVARAVLEDLILTEAHCLEAAEVLEPIYRSERFGDGLMRILEIKARVSQSPDERLAALEEIVELARTANPPDLARATQVVERGLIEAIGDEKPLAPWINHVEQLVAAGVDSKTKALVFARALGNKSIRSADMLELARRSAEILAEGGDVAEAISLYRRALTFDPTSRDLIERVDELLRDHGDAQTRIELYRGAFEHDTDPDRRHQLLHTIATIERENLKDSGAAITTYRRLLEERGDDQKAHEALVDLYNRSGEWKSLCDELERRLGRVRDDDARTIRATLAGIAASNGDSERAVYHAHALLSDDAITEQQLEIADKTAQLLDDSALAAEVLKRRISRAVDLNEKIERLEQLGALEFNRRSNPKAAIEIWREAARTAEQVDNSELACRLYEQIRSVAPHDLMVTGRLADLLEQANRWNDVPVLLNVLIEHAEEDDARVSILLRLSSILNDQMGQPMAALKPVAQAFALAAHRFDVLERFEHIAVSAGRIDTFIAALDEIINQSPHIDDRLRHDLLFAKARALSKEEGPHDLAASTYRALLSEIGLDETRQQATIESFESMLTADAADTARRDDRRWLLAWRANHGPERDRVAALLAWAAEEETTFNDRALALDLHRRALKIDPRSAETIAGFARLAIALGDVDGAVAALIAWREESGGTIAHGALDLQIATIFLDAGERLDDALASVASALETNPSDSEALRLATRLLKNDSTRDRTIELLEQILGRVDAPVLRADLLERLLAAPQPGAANGDRRKSWSEQLFEIRLAEDDHIPALNVVLEALTDFWQHESFWDRAEALARELERPTDIGNLYTRILEQSLTPDQAFAIGQRAVTFLEEWFEDPKVVIDVLERILVIDPNASWAFDKLKLIFDSAERWDDLFALYDRALLVAPPEAQLSLLEDVAQIAKDFAGDAERAIHYLEQIHNLQPGNASTASSLERLYERQGRYQELIRLLSGQLPTLPPDQAERTRIRIASLWLDQIENTVAAFEVVLTIRPSSIADDLSDDAIQLLERIVSKAPGKADERRQAASLLRVHYTAISDNRELVRILEVELEMASDERERVQLIEALASLYENLSTLIEAFEHRVALVLLRPENETYRARLTELAIRTGQHDRLAQVLTSAAERCEMDVSRAALLFQAACEVAGPVGDSERAIGLFLRVLSVNGASHETQLQAARNVAPLLQSTPRRAELVDVLERLAVLETSVEARMLAFKATAQLATTLGQHERAIAAWEARLRLAPHDIDALDGIVELLEFEEQWEPLIDILMQRAGAVERSESARRIDRVRIASLLANSLHRHSDAIDAWRAIEIEFGEDTESAKTLAVLLEHESRWMDLALLLEREAQHAQTNSDKAIYLQRLGDIKRLWLNDRAGAIVQYEAALTVDAHLAEARHGLHALLDQPSHRSAALDVLIRTYASTHEWLGFLDLTEHRLAAATTNAEEVQILLESSDLAEHRVADLPRAFESMRRAFALAPEDVRIGEQLERLARVTKSWQSYVDAHHHVLAHSPAIQSSDGTNRVRLLAAMGAAYARELSDPTSALDAYLKVTTEVPNDRDAVLAVIRLGGHVARWDAAATVVLKESSVAGGVIAQSVQALESAALTASAWDAVTRELTAVLSHHDDTPAAVARDLEAKVAEWHRVHRNDPDAAEASLQRALGHDADHPELLNELVALQRRTHDHSLVDSLLRLSRVRGGDLELLEEAAHVAAELEPASALNRSILEDLFERGAERWIAQNEKTKSSETALVVRAEPVPEPRETKPGKKHGKRGRGADRAAQSIDEKPAVPLIRPASSFVDAALDQLVTLYEASGDNARIVERLVRAATLPYDSSKTRAMRLVAARISLEQLRDRERATALYLELFDEDPNDPHVVSPLVELFEKDPTHDRLLTLRRRQVLASTSASDRIQIRLEIARLLSGDGEREASITSLRENLEESPREPETIQKLIALFQEGPDAFSWSILLIEQAQLAEQAGELTTAANFWADAANVAEHQLKDVDLAHRHHVRVIAIEPRASSLDALARLSIVRNEPAAAAGYLEQLLPLLGPDERPATVLRLIDALEGAGDRPLARRRLEREVERDPDAESLRDRLAGIYRGDKAWEPLAHLLALSAPRIADPTLRLARLHEAASLYRVECADPSSAIPLLEDAAKIDIDTQNTRLILADAMGSAGRVDEARSIIRELIEGYGARRPKERAPVHFQLARLELDTGERAAAITELDLATRIDPAHPGILQSLAELARDDEQFERAERAYRALLAVLRKEGDPAKSQIARSEVLFELSEIARRQDNADRATETFESALDAASRSPFDATKLEQAVRKNGSKPLLARVLEARLSATTDADARSQIEQELRDLA